MSTQCQRILERLEHGPATSWELGPELRILCPTKRISELRKHYEIHMSETWERGKRICTYSLRGQRRLWGEVA